MKLKFKSFASALFLPASLFYYELVFRSSTTHGVLGISFYPTLIFSLLYGGILFLILSFIKNKNIFYVAHLLLVFVTSLPFIIEFFVYRQFKVLYDLNTVFGGAGDVAGGFMDDVIRLLSSSDGLLHILLFLLPTIIFAITGRTSLFAYRSSPGLQYSTVFALAAFFITALFTVQYVGVFRNAYEKQYNFQSAVSNFGLITGIRLDAFRNLSGNDGGFEMIEVTNTEESQTNSDTVEEIKETKPEYGDNVLDIDFEALAQQSGGIYAEMDQYAASLKPSSQNA